jgi:RNA polymerase sigma-70 factor (ECF subfamily)
MLNISRNAAIDQLRSAGYRNSRKNQELTEGVYGRDQATEINTDRIGLSKFLQKLRPDLRVLLDLSYIRGYTHEEIAQIEDIPLGTVKTRIRSALIQLRALLK